MKKILRLLLGVSLSAGSVSAGGLARLVGETARERMLQARAERLSQQRAAELSRQRAAADAREAELARESEELARQRAAADAREAELARESEELARQRAELEEQRAELQKHEDAKAQKAREAEAFRAEMLARSDSDEVRAMTASLVAAANKAVHEHEERQRAEAEDIRRRSRIVEQVAIQRAIAALKTEIPESAIAGVEAWMLAQADEKFGTLPVDGLAVRLSEDEIRARAQEWVELERQAAMAQRGRGIEFAAIEQAVCNMRSLGWPEPSLQAAKLRMLASATEKFGTVNFPVGMAYTQADVDARAGELAMSHVTVLGSR